MNNILFHCIITIVVLSGESKAPTALPLETKMKKIIEQYFGEIIDNIDDIPIEQLKHRIKMVYYLSKDTGKSVEKEAALAYNTKAKELFDQYAYLNALE